ncbi:hypothetical protein C4559_05100 [Candidatus Microgenomates bacterium]|nr:MAG: hypothetical protein C4559_05100 [Candidatus Microgenomates bacterium]
MLPQTDYKKLLTEVIKKQIIILGPDITLTKARNVAGLTIADDGSVLEITGDPQVLTQKLIEQFTELSGLIVKKTMEPLLSSFPGLTPNTIPFQAPLPPQPTQQEAQTTQEKDLNHPNS